MSHLRGVIVVAWLLTLVSALVIPSRSREDWSPSTLYNLKTSLKTDHAHLSGPTLPHGELAKRRIPYRSRNLVTPPSNVIRAGANEDDRDTTEFFSVDDENRRVATWTWLSPQYVFHDDVDALRGWLMERPDVWVDISDNQPRVWRHGGVEVEVRALFPRSLILSRRVLAFWVAFIGTHRRGTHNGRNDMAPAGNIHFDIINMDITIRPVDPDEDDDSSPGTESDDDPWSDDEDESEGEGDSDSEGDLSEVENQLIDNANASHIVFDFPDTDMGTPPPPYTEYHPWWQIGEFGGPSPYLQKRLERRTFGIFREIWDRLFGHHNVPKEDKPYESLCTCQPRRIVVDLESELRRLQLDHLDLTSYTSEDPTEHERVTGYLSKLQDLPITASNGEKARAIASLLERSDDPSISMVESLETEMCGCSSGNGTDTAGNTKREAPAGLALSNFEDDRWNNQISKSDVDLLRHNLMHNGLTRVDPTWQSFQFRNAYVSWSKKFSSDTEGVAAPSWEEIYEYVDAFYNRVNWGNEDWWKEYEPIKWSTSYRDVLFGQRKMRLCISSRPKRCLD
ncbi:hypothetical protein A1Q2_00751 [Trichosporon asahii var. asahii CBS 8904]|uniref:Uncharacterized protein n=1 Tax=Trichosporon asahii var. asahii (strain CBS 8904) TaxID=1220162 RepID=K1VWP2_TRIAC|nr:hypothetical protein A1Q2_00751 [Trichosporon asahii var. asahii CBS 8904]